MVGKADDVEIVCTPEEAMSKSIVEPGLLFALVIALRSEPEPESFDGWEPGPEPEPEPFGGWEPARWSELPAEPSPQADSAQWHAS